MIYSASHSLQSIPKSESERSAAQIYRRPSKKVRQITGSYINIFENYGSGKRVNL